MSPAEASITVDGQPATTRFSARTRDGQDVTGQALWSLSPALGQVEGGVVSVPETVGRGGLVRVQAQLGALSGSALLRVRFIAPDVVAAGAPPDARAAFGAGGGGPPLDIIYPFDGALLARNIGQMRPAWRGHASFRLYRITLDSPLYQQSFYVGSGACSTGVQCSHLLDEAAWQNLTRHAGGQVTLEVAGTAGAGEPVGHGRALTLSFSPQDVRGGLYYFSTTRWGLMRLPFGASTAQVFIEGRKDRSVDRCVGCHAVSPDGKKVAAVWAGGDGWAGIVDGADPRRYVLQPRAVPEGQMWNFASFSPDGTRLITVWKGEMALRDGQTGALLRRVDPVLLLGGRASMPDWSPDGKSIVFVRIAPPDGALGSDITQMCRNAAGMSVPCVSAGDWILGDAGDIALLPVHDDGTFGQARILVPRQVGIEYHFYPSFSPDSRWIVFNSARAASCSSPTAANNGVDVSRVRCISYDQQAARLRLVRAEPGHTPLELRAATRIADRTTAWPKFAPFQQGSLVFFTYSAKFDYGWTVQQAQIRAATGYERPQIWMSALDLDRAERGEDPSLPPFWLPFQDASTNNHAVLWTRDIACIDDGHCGSGFRCVEGVCVPQLG